MLVGRMKFPTNQARTNYEDQGMLPDDRDLVRIATFEYEHEAILFRTMLNEHGIPAWVTGGDGVNTFGAGLTAAGLVGVDVSIHKANVAAAQAVLDKMESLEETIPAWKCMCGEQVDEGFSVCWSCGADIDEMRNL